MSISFTSLEPDQVTIKTIPPSYDSGELSSGAHPTLNAIITIPIPEGSDVDDFAVTFRDRRPEWDNDVRTVPRTVATKDQLLSNIVGWTSTDDVFNGVRWRKHTQRFGVAGTFYTYDIRVAFDSGNLLLIFTSFHFQNTNRYGGWENLVVNFTPTENEVTTIKEVEVEEVLGTYIPTLAEGRSISLVTGISMEAPATHVRIQFTGASGYYEMLLNLDDTSENVQGLPASSITYHQTNTIPIRIELEDASSGILRNITNEVNANSIIRRVDVYTRKKVKVLK